MSEERIVLLVGGDTVPTESNCRLFAEGDILTLVGSDIELLFRLCDYSIINLETPLFDELAPIAKCGPNLVAPTAAARGIAALGVDAVSLANNHIMDHGPVGLHATMKALDSFGIAHFGAGRNLHEASKPLVFENKGISIGIYSCAEHEFSIAGDSYPGANPYDSLTVFDHVFDLKSQCDYVVVLYHGGKEHYRYPSPVLQRVCRKLADKGADLVICQHSHCVGCMEKWKKSTIIYGQGNFLFDHSESEFWQTGLLIKVSFGIKEYEVEYIPLRKEKAFVRLASGSAYEDVIKGFYTRSADIKTPEFIEKKFREYAEKELKTYLKAFVPLAGTFGFRALNKITGGAFGNIDAMGEDWKSALNYLECEAHRELFSEGIKSKFTGSSNNLA